MENDDIATFRLPARWQVGIFAVVMLPSCVEALITLPFDMSLGLFLIETAGMALVWALLMRLYTVELHPDGVKIQSLWWLPWTDVNAVIYRKWFGLPYFNVKRRRGFSWWIPLYYVGDHDLGRAIIHAAAPGHPFRLVSMPL